MKTGHLIVPVALTALMLAASPEHSGAQSLESRYDSIGGMAILSLPAAPFPHPSRGGRLEEKNGFRVFIEDVMTELRRRNLTRERSFRTIVLSGHSGAYRMISFILNRGGMTQDIGEVFLFDALYGQLEKYAYWLDHFSGRLVAVYTDGGGTKGTTESLMEDLDAWRVGYAQREEIHLTDEEMIGNRILFIHTDLDHNEVLSVRNQFQIYLRTGMERF